MWFLDNCLHLTTIHLHDKINLDIVLQGLTAPTAVTYLNAYTCEISRQGVHDMAQAIPSLGIMKIPEVDLTVSEIDHLVRHCQLLSEFKLTDNTLATNTLLRTMGTNLTRLQTITVSDCPLVTDAGLCERRATKAAGVRRAQRTTAHL